MTAVIALFTKKLLNLQSHNPIQSNPMPRKEHCVNMMNFSQVIINNTKTELYLVLRLIQKTDPYVNKFPYLYLCCLNHLGSGIHFITFVSTKFLIKTIKITLDCCVNDIHWPIKIQKTTTKKQCFLHLDNAGWLTLQSTKMKWNIRCIYINNPIMIYIFGLYKCSCHNPYIGSNGFMRNPVYTDRFFLLRN